MLACVFRYITEVISLILFRTRSAGALVRCLHNSVYFAVLGCLLVQQEEELDFQRGPQTMTMSEDIKLLSEEDKEFSKNVINV